MKNGETFANAEGAWVETNSGVLVTVVVAGPQKGSEGTIIGVAYQGKNYVIRVSSKKKIVVETLAKLKEFPTSIKLEIQTVIDNWSDKNLV